MKRGVVRKKFAWTKRVVITASIAGLVILGLGSWLTYAIIRSHDTGIDHSRYQAVFLTNGQVYFGKLEPLGERMQLTDVFYLQNEGSNGGAENPQQAVAADEKVQLIKLGNEVHNPEDGMIITKDQILFYENLKPDGNVAKTMQNYNK